MTKSLQQVRGPDWPSYVGRRNKQFNPTTSFYNVTDTSMARLRGFLVKSQSQRVKIGFWGHSIFAGTFTSAVGSFDIASQVRRYLLAEQTNVNGTGFVYVENKIGTPPALGRDARWTSITGWTPANAVGSMYATTTTNGAVATFVSDMPGTIVDVGTYDMTGTLEIRVDGILKDTYTGPNPGAGTTAVLRSITGLANTRHTVTVTTTTTNLSALSGARVRNTTGIEVSNHGHGGSACTSWTPTGTYSQPYKSAQVYSPSEIVFLALGDGNEIIQGFTVGATTTSMQNLITALQATGAAVVLMTAPAMSPGGGAYPAISDADWDPFCTMLYDLADQYDLPLLDCRHLFINYTTANTNGWMGDNIHPSDVGHAVIARSLATEMLKVFPYDLKPDPLLEEWDSATPTAPTTGLKFYTKYGARRIPAFVAAGGQSSALQPAVFANKMVQCKAANAGTATTCAQMDGGIFTFLSNALATPLPITNASTNKFTEHVRFEVTTTATAGTGSGIRTTTAQWHISATAGMGGFFYVARAGFQTHTATNRAFMGMSATAAALNPAVDPSTLFNLVGFACNSAHTNWQFMHNDASGAATIIDMGANFPCQTSATDFFEFRVYAPPGVAQIEYAIRRENTGHFASGIVSTNLPVTGTMLCAHIHHGNGTTASIARTHIQSLYVESDN